MATQNVCSFNKYGYCKFRNNCRKMHVDEICENQACEITNCKLRHPRPCRYFRDFRRCKFSNCKFKHVQQEIYNTTVEKIKKENENILAKLACIDEKLKQINFQEKIIEIENKVDFVANFEKHLYKKDKEIETLNNTIKEMDEKIKRLSQNLEEMNENIGKINDLEEKRNRKDKKLLTCSNCSFQTNSEQGLKIHMKKKHTVVVETDDPKPCHLCDKQCKSSLDLKKHLITHTYKQATYKCDECDFVGQNEVTMEVHNGKHHSEKFECGLCDSEMKNLESLETHLNTCESFRCYRCLGRYKTLKEVKNHFPEVHKKEHGLIDHLKIDRNDCNEVTETEYCSDKI